MVCADILQYWKDFVKMDDNIGKKKRPNRGEAETGAFILIYASGFLENYRFSGRVSFEIGGNGVVFF